jgi:hypothetical protein
MDTKDKISQAQNIGKTWTTNPTQAMVTPPEPDIPPISDYSKVMYTPGADSTKPIDRFNSAVTNTGANSYTQYYEMNNKKHLPGFEIEGQLQLKADNIRNLEQLYKDKQIGYSDFLLESVGYDLMKKNQYRFDDPSWWYNRYLNNDFSDPRKDVTFLEEYIGAAETLLSESRISSIINNGGRFGDLLNETLGRYRSGDLASDETMSQFFGQAWEEAKQQFEGDSALAIRSLRGHTALGRMSEDGTKYIHTDGRIYDVVTEEEEAFSGRSAVAAVRYNADGSLDSVTINSNQLTKNIFIDNVVSGATGFMIDLGKTVGQVAASLIDIGEGLVTSDWEFDKVVNTGLAFEQFKASNAITAKAYVDLDGFEMNSARDWMAAGGDITGLLLGMFLTMNIGGGLNTAGQAIAKGGSSIAQGVGKTVSFSGKLLSSVSNLHNGSASRGFESALASRVAFSMTHASKDALSTYTYRKLAGASEDQAWASAGGIFLLNSAITFAIGSGSKDDTFRMYRDIIGSTGSRTLKSNLARFSFTKLGKFTDAATTAGMDFFDNYLTMSLAGLAEQTGDVSVGNIGVKLRELFAGEADFQQVMTAAVFASNAFRGVMNDYTTGTVSNKAISRTQKVTLNEIDKIIANPKSTPNDVSAMTAVRAEYDRIVMNPDPDKGGVLNALEYLHQTFVKGNDDSIVSRTFDKAMKDFDIQTYKEIGEIVKGYQDSHIERAGSWFHNVLSNGVMRGTWGMLRENTTVRQARFSEMVRSEGEFLKAQSGAFQRMSDPLAEAYKIYFGRDITEADEAERAPLFKDTKLFNKKNFKFNKKDNTYTIKLEGKGILENDPDFRAMNMILNRMADAGLINRSDDDKSNTVFVMKASMGKMTHAAQAIHDMFDGLIQLRKLTDAATPEDVVAIANKVKNILDYGLDEIKPEDSPETAAIYLIEAQKLGYIRPTMVVLAMEKLYSKTPGKLEQASLVNNELGAYAQALKFKKILDNGDTISLDEAPASGSEAEKIVVSMYGEFGKTIEQQVAAANERAAKSPQSFASTLDSEILRWSEEGLEVAREANTLLNPRVSLVNLFREGGGTFATVKNEIRKLMLAAGMKQSEWTGKNTTAERRLELLRQLVNIKTTEAGYEGFRETVREALIEADAYKLLFDVVKKNDVELKSETIQIKRGEILIDKSQFMPAELYKAFELIEQYKENATVIERKNKDSLMAFLKIQGIDVNRLEQQINLWNEILSQPDFSGNRFISVQTGYLEQLGYRAQDFSGYHTSKYPGIINGNAYTKGFSLTKKIKDLTIKVESVVVEGVTKEQYRIHAAGERLQGRFAITDDTLISAGEIGFLYGEISSKQKTGYGFINRFLTRLKSTTLGGKGFIGEAEAIRGKYNIIEMDNNSERLIDNKIMFDVIKNFEEHPVLETKIGYDPLNNPRSEDYISKYWTLEQREGEYYVKNLNLELIKQELAEGKAVSLRQVLLLDFLPEDTYTTGDLLDKNLQRSVINKNGSLYEQLAFLESDIAVKVITDSIKENTDVVSYNYDATPYQLKSNRVGDIIRDLETKSKTNAGLTPTEASLLRLLRYYRVDGLSVEDKILMDYDLLRYSQQDPRRTVDDLILYIADRQKLTPGLGEITTFNKNYFDGEDFDMVSDPRDLRNLESIYYQYDLNDGTLRTTLEKLMSELGTKEERFATNQKVVDEDRWKSLVYEIGDKQYIDYDSLFKADSQMIEGLKANLSKEDRAKLDLFLSEMEAIIGRTQDKDDFILEWRAPLSGMNQPSIKETIAFLLRGIDDEGKLETFINRASAQIDSERSRLNFNVFSKAFEEGFKDRNRFVDMREKMSEDIFNALYRNTFNKDNPEVFEEIKNSGRYVFLDKDGNVLYTAYGKTDLTDIATYAEKQLKNAKYMVAADLYSKSFFEDYRMSIIDLDEMSGTKSYKDHIRDYGQSDILNWLSTNKEEIRPVIENMNAYYKEYKKDKTSERGKMYAKYLQEVSDFVDSRLSNKKKITNAVTRFVTGSTKEPANAEEKNLIRTFTKVIETSYGDPRSAEANKDQLFFLQALKIDAYDGRVDNAASQRIFKMIINGVDIDTLDFDARKFVQQKAKAFKDQYIKGVDKSVLEAVADYVEQKVKAMNDSGQRTPREPEVSEVLKTLDDKKLQELIFAYTLEEHIKQGVNPNTFKFLLSNNTQEGYSFDKARQDKEQGLNFAFEDRYELATKTNYVLDVEAVVDDISNVNETFALSVSVREVDFNNNTVGVSRTYRFALDKQIAEPYYQRTIANMVGREDISGLERDYKISTSGNVKDEREELKSFLISVINNKNAQVFAHNGQEFDFAKVLANLYPELSTNFEKGNKTFIDSIDVLRSMGFKTGVEQSTRSNVEAYRNNALELNPKDANAIAVLNKGADHSSEGDTELLSQILLTFYATNKEGIKADHGDMVRDMEIIYRSIKGNEELNFDLKIKPNEIMALGYSKNPTEFFGLETSLNKLAEFQQLKSYRDYLVNRQLPYNIFRDNLSKILKNYNVSLRSEKLIEQGAARNVAKMASFLLDNDDQTKSLQEKFMKYLSEESKTKQTKDILEDLLDPRTYTEEAFNEMFGERGEELFKDFKNHKFNQNKALEKTTSDEMRLRLEQAPVKQYDYMFNELFNNIEKTTPFIDSEFRENLFQRMAESYRNRFVVNEDIAEAFISNYENKSEKIKDLPLLKFVDNKNRIKKIAEIVQKEIFDSLGARSTKEESTYGNARYMPYNQTYKTEGYGNKKLEANEVGITKETAVRLFGKEYDATNLYGYILRYPSDRKNSILPMKYIVVETGIKGQQFLIDDNVMLSLQGDFDGDKFAMFGNINEGVNKALEFLNKKYLSPYNEIRNEIETRGLIEGKTDETISKYFIQSVEHYEKSKEDPTYLDRLFKDSTIEEKQIRDFKIFLKGFDEKKETSIQIQKFLIQRSLINDQQKGMFQKSLTDADMERYISDSEKYFADKDNILTRGGVRDVVITDHAVESLKNRGFTDKQISDLVMNSNNKMLQDISRIESNKEFVDLIEAIDADGEARKTFTEAMRIAKNFDELNEKLNLIDTDKFFFTSDGEIKDDMLADVIKDLLNVEQAGFGIAQEFETYHELLNTTKLRMFLLDETEGSPIPPDTYGMTSRFADNYVANKAVTVLREDGFENSKEFIQTKNLKEAVVADSFNDKAIRKQLIDVMIGKMVVGSKIYFDDDNKYNSDYFKTIKTYMTAAVETNRVSELEKYLFLIKNELDMADPYFKETILKEVMFLNGIRNKKVGSKTKVKDLAKDATLQKWVTDTWIKIDDPFDLLGNKLFETTLEDFEYIPALNEMVKYLSGLEDSDYVQVYKGMPIFENFKTKETRNAPENGKIKLTTNGAILVTQNKVSQEAIKLAAEGSAAFKAMPFGNVIDSDEYDFVISSANIKGSKLTPAQIKALDVVGEKQEIVINGKTYKGTVIDSNVFPTENINSYSFDKNELGSVIVNNVGGKIDVTSLMANMNSAMGRVIFNEGQLRQLKEFKDKYTPTPVVQRDMSPVIANLKFTLILSALPEEVRVELTKISADQKIKYGNNIANRIDIFLSNIDKELKERNITTKNLVDKLTSGMDMSSKKNQNYKRMIEGILSYDDYLNESIVGVFGTDPEMTKGGDPKRTHEFASVSTRNNDLERSGSLVEVPGLKYMSYEKFMAQLGLYYDRYADQEAFELGYHTPGKFISLGTNSRFRQVNDLFANRIPNEAALNPIINSTKNGIVTKGMDNTYVLPSRGLKIGDETYQEKMEISESGKKAYEQIKANKFSELDTKEAFDSHLIAKAMDTAREMMYFKGNENNVLKFKQGITTRPISPIQTNDHMYTGYNLIRDPETNKLNFTGVLNKGEINYNVNDPKVIRVSSSADYFELTRREKEIDNIEIKNFTKPNTIIEIDFQPLGRKSNSLTEDFNVTLEQERERLLKLGDEIPRNEIIQPETGEVFTRVMLPPSTPVARNLFDVLRDTFNTSKTNYENNLDLDFTKSWWRSQGIRYDSDEAMRIDSAIKRVKAQKSIIQQEFASRIGHLYDVIRVSGKAATEQFGQYYLFSKILLDIREKQAVNPLLGYKEIIDGSYQKDIMNSLGVKTLQDAVKEMDNYVKGYNTKNGRITSELFSIQKDLLDSYRMLSNKTQNPLENGYALLFPIIKDMSDKKDNGKSNARTKYKIMFKPGKYDNQLDFMKLSDPKDLLGGMYRLASDIAELHSKTELSKELIATGLIRSEEVMNVAEVYLSKAFDEITSKEGKYVSNQTLSRMLGKLYTNLNAEDGEYLRSRYEQLQEPTEASRHNIKQFYGVTKNLINDIQYMVQEVYGPDVVSLEDIRSQLRSETDIQKIKLLERAENSLSELQNFYQILIAGTEAGKQFKEAITKEAGLKYSLTDKYGRKADDEVMAMLSESNLDYIEKAYRYQDTNNYLSDALMGDLYFGNKKFIELLNDNLYSKREDSNFKKILRKTSNTFNRFTFGNPFRVLRRVENWTFTDMWMVTMANVKAPMYLGEARREIARGYATRGGDTSKNLENFQRLSGNRPDTASMVDFFTRETRIFDTPAEARNLVQKAFDVSLEALTFQHQLPRYTLYLATMDEIEKTGSIQTWGAAYRYKDFIKALPTKEEQAFRLMQLNIASFGDFPYVIRDIAPLLMLTSFTLGQARWAADWGVSMKVAAMDVFKAMRAGSKEASKQDVSAAMKTLAYPTIVTGFGSGLGWLLLNFLGDLFGADDETKEEWLDEGRYLEVVGSLINGSPTFTASKASPVDIVFDDWIGTGIKGYEKDNKVLDVVSAYFNKHLLTRVNPAIKIPVESFTGKNYFGEFSTNDNYSTNFIENLIRKSFGMLAGTGTVNAYIDNLKFSEYTDNERPMATAIFEGMKDSIASEFGNSRSFKKGIKDFWWARGITHNQLNKEGYYDRDFTNNTADNADELYIDPNRYDEEKAAELTSVFRKIMTRNENPSTIYSIIQAELKQGTTISTMHAALNRVSVVRELKKLEDPQGFIGSLSEEDQIRLRSAIQYENETFPGIQDINLYSLLNTRKRYPYTSRAPYYRQPFQPYKRYLPRQGYRSQVNFYNNMGTYHPYYEAKSIHDRWKPKEEDQRDFGRNNRRRRR